MELVHYHFSFALLLYGEIRGQGPPASPRLAQGHLSRGRCLIAPADLLFLTVKVFTAVRRSSLLVLTRAQLCAAPLRLAFINQGRSSFAAGP